MSDKPVLNGVARIGAERHRQISQLGFTPEHDAEHDPRELVAAGMCYLQNEGWIDYMHSVPQEWPWEDDAWDPSDDVCRNLEKAGALIAAAIDRYVEESDE